MKYNYLYKCLACGNKEYSKNKIKNFKCKFCENDLYNLYEEINLSELGPCKLCIYFKEDKNECSYSLCVPKSVKNVGFDKIMVNPEDGIGCECFKFIVT